MSKMPEELYWEYNAKLARYKRMCQWLEQASYEEQLKQEENILQVIRDCSRLIVEIEKYRPMTVDEVRNGFPEEQ